MVNKMNIFRTIFLSTLLTFSFLFLVPASKADTYVYGGPKIIYYDVDDDDLQSTADELVSLGFSTATVEANTAGLGFDIGIGTSIVDSWYFEAGFAYLGEFNLKATMTGPAETLDVTSSAITFPLGAKYKLGDSDNNVYLKGGAHYWRQNSNIDTSLGSINMWGSGFDPMFGLGAQVGGLVLSYEHYSFSGVGAGAGIGEGGMSSLSLVYNKEF